MYTREQYLEGIKRAEARNACKFNLNKAKEFFEAGDFEALHKIVVGYQGWLRDLGIISEHLSGMGESWHYNGQLRARGTYVDGKAHGAFESFYENGQISMRCTYEHGKLLTVVTGYGNGSTRTESFLSAAPSNMDN